MKTWSNYHSWRFLDLARALRHLKILEHIGMTKQRQPKNDPYSLDTPVIVEFHVYEGGK